MHYRLLIFQRKLEALLVGDAIRRGNFLQKEVAQEPYMRGLLLLQGIAKCVLMLDMTAVPAAAGV